MEKKSFLKVVCFSFVILITIFINACKSEIGIVTTTEATVISPNSAICGGNISSESGTFINSKGVYWSTTSIGKITKSTKYTVDGALDGAFESKLTDLSPSTTYYVRAYVGSNTGIELGNEINFTTLSGILVLSTFEISNITSTSAVCGGKITDDQNTTISATGICFSTDSLPTTDNSKVICPINTDSFSLTVTRLIPATTYYFRAFATNSYGTQYGKCVKFKTIATVGAISLKMEQNEKVEFFTNRWNKTDNHTFINKTTARILTFTLNS